MKRYIYAMIVIVMTLGIVTMEKAITEVNRVKNLDRDTICIEDDLDSSYITAMQHTINVYNELEQFNFDFIIKEDCSKGYMYTVVEKDLSGKTLGQARTFVDYKGNKTAVQLRFDNDIELSFNHKIHISLHEFGHLVGMKDVYDKEFKGKTIMYGYSSRYGDTYLLTLTDLDVLLLRIGVEK